LVVGASVTVVGTLQNRSWEHWLNVASPTSQ